MTVVPAAAPTVVEPCRTVPTTAFFHGRGRKGTWHAEAALPWASGWFARTVEERDRVRQPAHQSFSEEPFGMSNEEHVSARAPVEHLGRTAARLTGQWRFDLTTGRWWWSEETYRIHGFEPHEVVPTTALVLAHKHPADRERFREVFEAAKVSGGPFHSVHRIMDARGHERIVTLVGQGRLDPDTGGVLELMGYFVDITAPVAQRAEHLAGKHIRAAATHRGTIEQAKGILTVTHGLTIAEAFQLLRGTSNQHNVPVRDLAERLVTLGRILPVDEHRRHAVDEFLRNPA
ncbi:PAS and ANTAR domain-containing protein [Oerskovia sp. NPDC056781]|uniref:PAS and ANTAR domain-containing protein n=1 Tax=Oerskovia sp. NPDC056781 TaxID=3345942 RepID=UPI00366D88CC